MVMHNPLSIEKKTICEDWVKKQTKPFSIKMFVKQSNNTFTPRQTRYLFKHYLKLQYSKPSNFGSNKYINKKLFNPINYEELY